jgi:hypothetical protein
MCLRSIPRVHSHVTPFPIPPLAAARQFCYAVKNGTSNMFLATSEAHAPVRIDDTWLDEGLMVFEGELTCCALNHTFRGTRGDARTHSTCDREILVKPILGLYAELMGIHLGQERAAQAAAQLLQPREGEGAAREDDATMPAWELELGIAAATEDLIVRASTAVPSNGEARALAIAALRSRLLSLAHERARPLPAFRALRGCRRLCTRAILHAIGLAQR